MKFIRNLRKAIRSSIPHLEIVFCLMFTTFFIVDCFNNAMMFITHPMSKALTAVIGVFALFVSIILIFARRYAIFHGLVSDEMPLDACFSLLLMLVFVISLIFWVYDLVVPDRLIYTQRLVKNILMFFALQSFIASILTIRLQRKIFRYRHHIHRKRHHKERRYE